MNWQLFAWLFGQIDTPTIGFVNEAVTALSAHLAPVMRWGIVAYVAGQMMVFAYNPSSEPLTSFLGILTRCAIAYAVVASAANYNEYLGTLLRTTLPTEIGNVVAGAAGAPPVEGATFDGIWNKAWAAGLAVYRNLPWTLKAVGLTVCIALYWLGAIFSIGITKQSRRAAWAPVGTPAARLHSCSFCSAVCCCSLSAAQSPSSCPPLRWP